jgi:hypothetical protein
MAAREEDRSQIGPVVRHRYQSVVRILPALEIDGEPLPAAAIGGAKKSPSRFRLGAHRLMIDMKTATGVRARPSSVRQPCC